MVIKLSVSFAMIAARFAPSHLVRQILLIVDPVI